MAQIRVVTYNIHKGVQGFGPWRRLEIHNLGHAVAHFDADIVCLQEVRKMHHKEAEFFPHWPDKPQADFLAPHGYEAVYRTNAFTRHGEHGNAMLSRWPVLSHQHRDISDHRFEQRGFLHSVVQVHGRSLHVFVVHLGLIRASRIRQVDRLRHYIEREIPDSEPVVVAGDFNDWGMHLRHRLADSGLHTLVESAVATFPSRWPLAQLDYVYARGLEPVGLTVPRGDPWHRLSDHLPLLVEFNLPTG